MWVQVLLRKFQPALRVKRVGVFLGVEHRVRNLRILALHLSTLIECLTVEKTGAGFLWVVLPCCWVDHSSTIRINLSLRRGVRPCVLTQSYWRTSPTQHKLYSLSIELSYIETLKQNNTGLTPASGAATRSVTCSRGRGPGLYRSCGADNPRWHRDPAQEARSGPSIPLWHRARTLLIS